MGVTRYEKEESRETRKGCIVVFLYMVSVRSDKCEIIFSKRMITDY